MNRTRSLAIGLLGVACGGEEPASAPAAVPVWALEPVVTIGSVDDPETTLTEIRDLTVGPAGSLYLVQRGSAEVAVFSSAGEPQGTIGRRGQGPGEFVTPARIGWLSDTLWVTDSSGGKVSLFDGHGNFGRAIAMRGDAAASLLNVQVLALLPDGSVLAEGASMTEDEPFSTGVWGLSAPDTYVRLSGSGEILSVVAKRAFGPERFLNVQLPGGGVAVGRHPVDELDVVAPARDGSFVLKLRRQAARSLGSASFVVWKIGLNGDTLLSRRCGYTPSRLLDSWVDYFIRRTGEGIANRRPGSAASAIEAAYIEQLTVPTFEPPVTSVVMGSDGTVWIQRESRGRETVLWEVRDSELELLAAIQIPESVRLLHANRGFAWGVERGDFDVVHVIGYAVRASDEAKAAWSVADCT